MSNRTVLFSIIGFVVIAGGVIFATVALSGAYLDKQQSAASSDNSRQSHDHASAAPVRDNPALDLTGQSEVTMDIKNHTYEEANIKIKQGTKVTWTNQDTDAHNVMKEHDHSDHVHAAPTLDEIRPDVFDGPLLTKGESYSFTFNETGRFPYHCAPHPSMRGTVTVVE